ncbi:MAG: YqhA family protein [Burkholderiaceae bacterium]
MTMHPNPEIQVARPIGPLASFSVMSRWLQPPLYLGLILAQCVYVHHFQVALSDLIDVVMISNLLIMVMVGGYETLVSRTNLEQHPDQPEWLSYVNATVLKVKLGTAIIGISSIHLLKTFINARAYDEKALLSQTGIHLLFLIPALAIACSDRIMAMTANADRDTH